MRTKSSSTSSAGGASSKVYINEHSLSVRGEKIAVGAHPCSTRRRIEIGDSPLCLQRPQEFAKRPKPALPVKLSRCAPPCDDLCTRQVRKIRETAHIGELERLLVGLNGSKQEVRHGHRKQALNPAAYDHVYHKHFGVYYDLLHQVVKASKMSSIT